MNLKFSHFDSTLKNIDEENYSVRAVFSTSDVDRHGEVVDQKSWILDSYLKNPVILFGHDHNQPPVGKVTGLGYNADGNLEGTIQFAAKEYPFADVLWKLYKGGFMRAFSVGFSSKTVDVVDGQVILKDNELYEISTVSVPANAMALAKSKGLNVEPLESRLATQLAAKMAEDAKIVEVVAGASCTEHSEKDCANCPPSENVKDTIINLDEEAAAVVEEAPVEGVVTEEEEVVVEETEETVDDGATEEVETKSLETEEKGAVADAVAEVDEREKKAMMLQSVYDILDAFFNLAYDSDTSSANIPALISEMADLLKGVSGDVSGTKALEAEVARASATEVKKTAEDLILRVKEGRVLSKTNRTAVENAIEALQKVLDADKSKDETVATEDKDVLRANIAEKSGGFTAATPAAGVAASKGASKSRAINKAVRSLLAEKRKLKR